ncbi:MAG TPA: isoprenylcysteine carboxylmethyltransferase family protein [Burkholderiales bacterium]|jgi:protein-S-isoprenylcysteine O-methyltransferase Ste14
MEEEAIAPRSGLKRLVYDLRHNRYRSRQFVGIVFLIVLTVVGAPIAEFYYWGVLAAVLGILVRLWASGHVKKDKILATTGPYAYVRHPLYVGNHLIMVGFCLASSLWWSFVAWIALSLFYYPQTIAAEDRQLAKLFPGQWEDWARETQALMPRPRPYRSGQTSEWSFKQSLKQNGEPIIAALLLFCLYILYRRLG